MFVKVNGAAKCLIRMFVKANGAAALAANYRSGKSPRLSLIARWFSFTFTKMITLQKI